MTKHTPTPWILDATAEVEQERGIFGSDGRRVTSLNDIAESVSLGTASANAELIVRAVNAHEDLLEACRQLLDIVTKLSTGRGRDGSLRSQKFLAQQAIAKAIGRP